MLELETVGKREQFMGKQIECIFFFKEKKKIKFKDTQLESRCPLDCAAS